MTKYACKWFSCGQIIRGIYPGAVILIEDVYVHLLPENNKEGITQCL